jgi:hypothetical protein
MRKITFILLLLSIAGQTAGCAADQTITSIVEATATIPPLPTLTPTQEESYTNVHIPTGLPAAIDGIIDPDEWADADMQEMNDGSKLYLKYAEDALYLAIDAQEPGTVNLGIIRDGELWILHSSAALGSAVFSPHEDGWQLRKTYEWCCRATYVNSELDSLMVAEGWLSTNQFVGNENQTEYLVEIPEEEIIISITYIFYDGINAAYWPLSLAHSDLLLFSSQPQVGDQAIFTTDDWVQLIVKQ